MSKSFVDQLLRYDSFVIVTHIRPDGDAIGSQLGLGRLLLAEGKKVMMVCADHPPRNVSWIDADNQIEVFDRSPSQLIRIGEADAIVVVDANALHRVGPLQETISDHRGKRFVLDHHPDPDPDFDHSLVDPSRSSTGEMVFDLYEHHRMDLLDAITAEALYVAILTDTGSFRFNNVSARVHEIVAKLMEIGSLLPEDIFNKVYKTRSFVGQRLLGLALQTLTLVCEGKAALMSITVPMLDRTGAHTEDAEGFTDHMLAIEGVNVAIFAMQVGDHVKLSLRSQGDVPVNSLAAEMGGGGHFNASGAFVRGTVDSVLRKVRVRLEHSMSGAKQTDIS